MRASKYRLPLLLTLLSAPLAAQAAGARVDAAQEPLLSAPGGASVATVLSGAAVSAGNAQGALREVTLEGWVRASSLRPNTAGGRYGLAVRSASTLHAAPDGGTVARLNGGMVVAEVERRGDWVRIRRSGFVRAASLAGGGARPASPSVPASAQGTRTAGTTGGVTQPATRTAAAPARTTTAPAASRRTTAAPATTRPAATTPARTGSAPAASSPTAPARTAAAPTTPARTAAAPAATRGASPAPTAARPATSTPAPARTAAATPARPGTAPAAGTRRAANATAPAANRPTTAAATPARTAAAPASPTRTAGPAAAAMTARQPAATPAGTRTTTAPAAAPAGTRTATAPAAARPATTAAAPARTVAAPASPARTATATRPAASRPAAGARQPVVVHSAPNAGSVAVVNPDARIQVLGRQGEWTRVRVEGWTRSPVAAAADSAVTLRALREDPDAHAGREVDWQLRFVSLQQADAARTDLNPGEPYLLARDPNGEAGYVYVAVPPSMLGAVRKLVPYQSVRIAGRIRVARSPLMGHPIVDLVRLR